VTARGWLKLLALLAGTAAFIGAVDRLAMFDGPATVHRAATTDAHAPRQATGASRAGDSASQTGIAHTVFFDGGYAVGPGEEIRRTMAEQLRGTRTACGQPPLSTEARAFREALALFPDGGPAEDRVTRLDQLEAMGRRRERWDRMDTRSFGIGGPTSYIRAHAGAFTLQP
jgi:hypothetical protein